MKNKILVKYSSNWADEFDVDGFIVLDKEAWEERKIKNKEQFEEEGCAECYFGTNESQEYASYSEWINDLEEIDVTEEEAEFIEKNFGTEYGIFIEPYQD